MGKTEITLIKAELTKLRSTRARTVRFAPSPTGHFHVGNLRTAWIAAQIAKILARPLWMRFEDIDFERSKAEFEISQLADMRALGVSDFVFDRQSERLPLYGEIFRLAVEKNFFYPCSCSRKEVEDGLKDLSSAPHGKTPVYNGNCRELINRSRKPKQFLGWRYKNPDDLSGKLDFLVTKTHFRDDFSFSTVKGEFFPSYLLASAIDDYFSGCDLIVRAWDLENVITQSRSLMTALGTLLLMPCRNDPKGLGMEVAGGPLPAIFHTSLVTDNSGHRLEKRTQGVTLKEILEKIQLGDLQNLLSASFSSGAANEFSSAKIWGETKKSLTLFEIGLK